MATLEIMFEGGMVVQCAPAKASAHPAPAVDVAYIPAEGEVQHMTAAEYAAASRPAPVRKVLGIAIVESRKETLSW
jgi:hypothetical protein